MHLFKNEINRKGSASWLLCNDNSKSEFFRNKFIKENGGTFGKKGRYWEWTDDNLAIVIIIPEQKDTKKFIFADADGKQHTVYNLTEFANKHGLSRQKLYDLMKGDRKSHKGYTFIAKYDPQEDEKENPA